MFITVFNPLSFQDGLFDRPDYWVLADMESGELITTYVCNTFREEFCESEYSRRYDLRLVEGLYSIRFFDETFGILDEVRKFYIETGVFQERRYKTYLRRILKACPLPYRKFFRSLSL